MRRNRSRACCKDIDKLIAATGREPLDEPVVGQSRLFQAVRATVPVLALVQLNRNRATRADKRPQLADLRESGDLENTPDSVLGLYREEIADACGSSA